MRRLDPKIAAFLILALLLADRALKALALSLGAQGRELSLIRPALHFVLFRNEGIAFSLPFSGPFVWLASLVIMAIVGRFAWQDFRDGRSDRAAAFTLFILGASSNLYDRIAHGFTVDYFLFFSRSAVNLADGMIVGGALLLFFSERRK